MAELTLQQTIQETREEVAKAIVTAHMRGKKECKICIPAKSATDIVSELRNKGYLAVYTFDYPNKVAADGTQIKDWSKDIVRVCWD